MLEVYRLFALHCLLISGLTSVLYLCSASFFLSLRVSFPQCWRFQGDPSTIAHLSSVVAWMWSRTWRTVLVNGFCYPEPFKRLKKNVHWHSLDLLWLVDNRYTVLFCFETVWTVCLDFPCFGLSFDFFLILLPSTGCDCSRAEGQQFWHLQPSEGISKAICDPPGYWISNPPCLGLGSQTTKPHLGLIWSSESLTLVHTLIPMVQHIPTYCCTKRVYKHRHPEHMDYDIVLVFYHNLSVQEYRQSSKVDLYYR